jgi:hypothetical protein
MAQIKNLRALTEVITSRFSCDKPHIKAAVMQLSIIANGLLDSSVTSASRKQVYHIARMKLCTLRSKEIISKMRFVCSNQDHAVETWEFASLPLESIVDLHNKVPRQEDRQRGQKG